MALNKGIWDPKPRGTNIKGTNLKSLMDCCYWGLGASKFRVGSSFFISG